MAEDSNADRGENPVLRVLGAIAIVDGVRWFILVAGIFVAMIAFGSTLGRVIGAVLLVLLAAFVWRDVRRT